MPEAQRAIAQVPRGFRHEGVHWLALEWDPDSGGYFLFSHEALQQKSKFDSWHSTRDGAIDEAESLWRVAEGDWREVPEMTGS